MTNQLLGYNNVPNYIFIEKKVITKR